MKTITIRMMKGNSVIFADISTRDKNGADTENERDAVGYYVNGAAGSISSYSLDQKDAAFASFYAKIGAKVAEGYKAERV